MSKRRGCGGCFFRIVLASFVVLLVVGGGLAYLLSQPYKGFADSVFLIFTIRAVFQKLSEVFEVLVALEQHTGHHRAYDFFQRRR